jgi:hypothetical protein
MREGYGGLPTLTRWFLKTAMLYFLGGFGLGGVLLMTLGRKHQAIFVVLQPVYWHLLVVGWLMQCIFGVAYWMFPPFAKDQLQRGETLGWFTYGALNMGLLLRAVVEPWHSLSPQTGVGWLLIPSAVLQVAAVWVFVASTWGRIRSRRR